MSSRMHMKLVGRALSLISEWRGHHQMSIDVGITSASSPGDATDSRPSQGFRRTPRSSRNSSSPCHTESSARQWLRHLQKYRRVDCAQSAW
mmetsp:Transcript_9155/g.14584  ORF Transcript_9155/g.14584 Transcript_9155/m.14584 type:complete len:91 (+) Transcript_9155:8-280(+)